MNAHRLIDLATSHVHIGLRLNRQSRWLGQDIEIVSLHGHSLRIASLFSFALLLVSRVKWSLLDLDW